MAASVLTATLDKTLTDVSERYITYRGTIAVAAGDYATGGNTLNLSTIGLNTSRPPSISAVDVFTRTSIYTYFYIPGTTLANGKLTVYDGGQVQLSAAATPAGVVADTIYFTIRVKKGS